METHNYRRLAAHVAAGPDRSATLTFGEIERILGGALPLDAYERRQWWLEKGRGPARSLLSAGWHIESVDVLGQVATFRRSLPRAVSRASGR